MKSIFFDAANLSFSDCKKLVKNYEEMVTKKEGFFAAPHVNNIIALNIADSHRMFSSHMFESKITDTDKIITTIQLCCAMFFVEFIFRYYDKYGDSDIEYRLVDIKTKYQEIIVNNFFDNEASTLEELNSSNTQFINDFFRLRSEKKQSLIDLTFPFFCEYLDIINNETRQSLKQSLDEYLRDNFKF